MKLIAELNDEKREVVFSRTGETVSAEIDGRVYEIEAREVEPNVFLLKHENKIYQVNVSAGLSDDAPFAVSVGDSSFEVRIADPKRLRGAAGGGAAGAGLAEIRTAMPGKVVRILTEPGAEISQGEGVLIVEAMKMQNEMKSPKNGVVKEIRVTEGSTVQAGEVLAVIE